jgi:amidase
VQGDFWAAEAIMACRDAGILDGFADSWYRPEMPVSRDQIAVYIARALVGGEEAVPAGPSEPSFRDVPTDHWAFSHIEYVKDAGIVTGYPDSTYHPSEDLTRAEMAAFIARSIVRPTGDEGLVGYDPPTSPTFSDVEPGFWAYRYVEYLVAAGIVAGYDSGAYRPDSVCTRAEAAVYLARAFLTAE